MTIPRLAFAALAMGLSAVLVSCSGSPCTPSTPPNAPNAPSRAGTADGPSNSSGAPAAPPSATAAANASAIDAIFATAAEGEVPGCAVGVYRAGEMVFERGYGYASLENGVKIAPTTRFHVASITKQFTAASILLLAGDGKLAVTDDIRKYLPELRNTPTITLDHLLHHTSGIRSGYALLALEGYDGLVDRTRPDDALWLFFHQRALDWAPGTRYDYMAGNYWLLAEIVRRVSGMTLAAFAKSRIFEPLGMAETQMKDDYEAVIPQMATGYEGPGTKGYAAAAINMEIVGGIGVVTTVRDLAKWDANFYDPKVGGPALVAGLRLPGRLNDGTVLQEARGLDLDEVGGIPRESYRGLIDGFHAFLARYPSQKLGVAVLCNARSLNAGAFADKVAALYLPKRAVEPHASAPAATAQFPPLDAAIPGVYLDRATFFMRVFAAKDDGLVIRADPNDADGNPIARTGEREFVAGGVAHYVFHPADGKAAAFVVRTMAGEPTSTMVRVEPMAALSAIQIQEYAGRYASDEIARDWEFVVKGGQLFGRPWGGVTPPEGLEALSPDLFKRGDDVWEFKRDARGRIAGAVYSGLPDALGVRYARKPSG